MHKETPNIIICEDDAITSESIKVSLKKNGYVNIATVKSGEDLIELAVNTKTSLIISDITLSGDLDGIEAISRIMRVKKIPYIFITGHPEYLSLIDSYNLQPRMVYTKPVNLSDLVSDIRDIIRALS
jgi:DNA-binding NarL/FixJ family response regulator